MTVRDGLFLGGIVAVLVGVAGQFGPFWALIVGGVGCIGAAALLAIDAMRADKP